MEIWKPIKGFEGLYSVSNLGRVKSHSRRASTHRANYKVKERILKSDFGRYPQVNLYKDGKRKAVKVHWVVAEAFLPKVEGKKWINHIDEDKTNNCIWNLEWCTPQENLLHSSYKRTKEYRRRK